VGLERGPLSLTTATKELLERKCRGSGLENREYFRRGSAMLTTCHPSILKSQHWLRRQAADRYSSLADSGHEVCFCSVSFCWWANFAILLLLNFSITWPAKFRARDEASNLKAMNAVRATAHLRER
jgi:hypothetical protein